MLTEDNGMPGNDRFELELGFERVREGDASTFEVGPRFSRRALDNLELFARPAWLDLRGPHSPACGCGDTALNVKWRFHVGGP